MNVAHGLQMYVWLTVLLEQELPSTGTLEQGHVGLKIIFLSSNVL